MRQESPPRSSQARVAATSFTTLFAIVGLALYGLPFFYDFMVKDFGWTRAQVTSGNAYSKLIVGPLFGFAAGWFVDRFGPRRLMIVGILMAGTALIGLGSISTLSGFYFFYLFNAIGYVMGGPLPNQVLLSRWFSAARGRAMGFAYLGIGLGGALVPLISVRLVAAFGWHAALAILGTAIIVIALPLALFVPEAPPTAALAANAPKPAPAPIGAVLRQPAFYLLMVGSMCSIAAVGGANQHLKLYLSLDHGYTQGDAATIASLTLAASLIGRLAMGWLADEGAASSDALRDLISALGADTTGALVVDMVDPHPALGERPLGGHDLRGGVRDRPGWGVHGHPADGRGAVRHSRPRSRDGHRAGSGWCGGGARAGSGGTTA